ncbi:hypothetical protein [Sulfuracidifex metallicus]|uniref:Endonuclease n=1 Tax=Sulfuracidifex metallicus DSM 6482 = JCM 9184 TaxID=523847 RepID=A0A6A9QIZ8_SULME|nr:hypothetical protein [Sulfuracidifex metallicus]MUN29257.1 hypothetical protein [Sulfuracidifex metallicus DSM 6482 = JCM 9184]WOE50225.1 hypothetical protein RQ359_001740 [Sulfuracidifex metallicus DSM 6482 = JCM 9184]
MNTLDELKSEYNFSDEELEYALSRAKGIIFGFAMEYRARRILEDMKFTNIRSVDMPTHDIEADKEGQTFYIEVKATKRSPTKEYSAYKIAMIATLDGPHLTLLMKPEPSLLVTEEILSEPKRILLRFFRLIYEGKTEDILTFIEDTHNREVISSYGKVIKNVTSRMKGVDELDFIKLVT